MAQKIKRANIFGRLGSALAEGVESSFDKGMERGELSSDLKRLQNEDMSKLTPTQRLLKSSTPATLQHPQFIQSLGRLSEQEARGEAARGFSGSEDKTQIPSFLQKEDLKAGAQSDPSITRGNLLEQIQQGAIPPSKQEEYKKAAEIYEPNKQFFKNDFNNALEYVQSETQRNQERQQSIENLDQKLLGIQDRVKSNLSNHSKSLNVEVPSNVYQKIQGEALESVRPKKDGGRGLTEEQAGREYSKKLDELSRLYGDLKNIDKFSIVTRSAEKTLNNLENMQKEFEDNDDTRNMGDTLISDGGLTPAFAYSIAEPIKREKELNRVFKEIPSLPKDEFSTEELFRSKPQKSIPSQKERDQRTLDVMPKILDKLGKKGSPLAVMYELDKKGYNSQVAKKFFLDNEEKLTGLQSQQLRKTEQPLGTLYDWWLKTWSGIKE